MPIPLIAAGIGGVGSLLGGAIGASAAGSAAQTQSDAAIQAAQIQANEADKALQFQEGQYQTGQQELAPWLTAGTTALANLEQGLGLPVQGNVTLPGAAQRPAVAPRQNTNSLVNYNPGGRFGPGNSVFDNPRLSYLQDAYGGYRGGGMPTPAATPGTIQTHTVPTSSLVSPNMAPGSLNFTPPTGLTMQNDPGYQTRLALGTQAIENSAASRGDLLTGGEGRALTDYAQNFASNEYSNVYQRAFQNNLNAYNRLASLAGLGQETATGAVSAGNQSSNSIANTLMSLGMLQGQAYNNAGAARAAGTIGGANAWSGALGNIGNYAAMLPLLQMLNNQNQNQGNVDLSV